MLPAAPKLGAANPVAAKMLLRKTRSGPATALAGSKANCWFEGPFTSSRLFSKRTLIGAELRYQLHGSLLEARCVKSTRTVVLNAQLP